MVKLILKDCQLFAEENGGKCLSTKYINNKMKMHWKCAEGHTWESSFSNIKNRKRWCPDCCGYKKN